MTTKIKTHKVQCKTHLHVLICNCLQKLNGKVYLLLNDSNQFDKNTLKLSFTHQRLRRFLISLFMQSFILMWIEMSIISLNAIFFCFTVPTKPNHITRKKSIIVTFVNEENSRTTPVSFGLSFADMQQKVCDLLSLKKEKISLWWVSLDFQFQEETLNYLQKRTLLW